MSGLRLDAGQAGRAMSAGQFLIGDDAVAREPSTRSHRCRSEAIPTTRATQRGPCTRADAVVVLDRDHPDPDPEGHAERRIAVDPRTVRRAGTGTNARPADPARRRRWTEPGARPISSAAMPWICSSTPGTNRSRAGSRATSPPSCPTAHRSLIGSSTPVRDLDLFMAPRRPAADLDRARPAAHRREPRRQRDRRPGRHDARSRGRQPRTDVRTASATCPSCTTRARSSWSSTLGVDAVLRRARRTGRPDLLDARSTPRCRSTTACSRRRIPASIRPAVPRPHWAHGRVERAGDLSPRLERAAEEGGVQVVEVAIDAERDRVRRAELRAAVSAALSDR